MKGKISGLFGTKDRPRLSVSVTLKNIIAQVIDDEQGHTLACVTTMDKELKKTKGLKANIESAKIVGSAIGKKAVEKGITKVVFDRRSKKYHGKLKALADAARAAGLKF